MKTALIVAQRIFIVLVLLWALIYMGDYASVRYRMAKNTPGDPFGTITFYPLVSIQLKGGKTDYESDVTQPEKTLECVRSLFPHYGYDPCWYVNRENKEPLPLVLFLPRIAPR